MVEGRAGDGKQAPNESAETLSERKEACFLRSFLGCFLGSVCWAVFAAKRARFRFRKAHRGAHPAHTSDKPLSFLFWSLLFFPIV